MSQHSSWGTCINTNTGNWANWSKGSRERHNYRPSLAINSQSEGSGGLGCVCGGGGGGGMENCWHVRLDHTGIVHGEEHPLFAGESFAMSLLVTLVSPESVDCRNQKTKTRTHLKSGGATSV
jgi:predicted Rossmann-fold nucleotide-binding protein